MSKQLVFTYYKIAEYESNELVLCDAIKCANCTAEYLKIADASEEYSIEFAESENLFISVYLSS